jgi:hypothetical protein
MKTPVNINNPQCLNHTNEYEASFGEFAGSDGKETIKV